MTQKCPKCGKGMERFTYPEPHERPKDTDPFISYRCHYCLGRKDAMPQKWSCSRTCNCMIDDDGWVEFCQLHAAAPEMAGALAAVILAVDAKWNEPASLAASIELARAALRKARGEE